jgi:tRNA(fMet)-specific endonuclease VapC
LNEFFLLDTNALSEPIQRSPNPTFLSHFRAHTGQMATAAPTLHEMIFGCRRLPPSRRRSEIEGFIQSVVIGTMLILPYDRAAAEWHAAERVRLSALGRTPTFVDGQIAAVAATRGLILVTANVADFQHFAGLTIVDWRI